MRGTVAKKLRKKVYGDKDYRERKYSKVIGTVVSDKERKWYKNAKKVFTLLKKKDQKKEKQNGKSNVVEHN